MTGDASAISRLHDQIADASDATYENLRFHLEERTLTPRLCLDIAYDLAMQQGGLKALAALMLEDATDG